MQFHKQVKIEKVDDELRIAYGWAYVCEEGGQIVADVSEQCVTEVELRKAVHGFARSLPLGTVLHKQLAGQVVDTIFFSKSVQQALGVDLGKVGWFVGVHVLDDEAWAGVKDGTYTAFSIGGIADEVPYAEVA